jgi:anti-anti-sigma factor
MPICKLTFAQTDCGCCIRVEGWGTMKQSRASKDVAVAALNSSSDARVVFDLSTCTYLDSTFLGCLIDLYRGYGRTDPPRFCIAAPAEVRARLLKACGLERLLPSMDALPQTVAGFTEIPERVFDTQDLMKHVMECHQSLAEADSKNRDFFLRIASELQKELASNPQRF